MFRFFLFLITTITLVCAQEPNARKLLDDARAAVDIRSTGPFLMTAKISAGLPNRKVEGKYRFVWVSEERWREDAIIGPDYVVNIRDGVNLFARASSRTAEFILEPFQALRNYGTNDGIPDGIPADAKWDHKNIRGNKVGCFEWRMGKYREESVCLKDGLIAGNDESWFGDFRAIRGEKYPFRWDGKQANPAIVYSAGVEAISALGDVPNDLFHVDDTFRKSRADCPSRISSGASAANKISGKNPSYPPIAKQNHVQGTVVIRATIDDNGSLADIEAIIGPPRLREAALEAVKDWKYIPATCGGKSVPVDTTIRVTFSLGG
jgi:TonB family protein